LLDFLAATLVEKSWSFKAMHRLIMTSAAYRRSAQFAVQGAPLSREDLEKAYAVFKPRRLSAEELRDAMLAAATGTKIHCQHLSSAGSVDLLRAAKARGIALSGEVCPHHLALTDEALQGYDTNAKMNPPLREQSDIDALLGGIADGTIDILATDHAPHAVYEKEVEFAAAPFGIVGLETAVGIFCEILLHRQRVVDLPRLVAMLTLNPARLLGLDRGTLAPGAPGDVTLFDPDRAWVVDKEQFASKGRNTPFHGWPLRGRAVRTIVGGRTVWEIPE
jgi:dihydroorotase